MPEVTDEAVAKAMGKTLAKGGVGVYWVLADDGESLDYPCPEYTTDPALQQEMIEFIAREVVDGGAHPPVQIHPPEVAEGWRVTCGPYHATTDTLSLALAALAIELGGAS